MVGLAIQIVAFVIVATAVIYGGFFVLGLLGLGVAAVADSGNNTKRSEPKAVPIPDGKPIDKNVFEELLKEYASTIKSLQDPNAAKNYAALFESKFLIGKRLMRMMLNIEEFYTSHYKVPQSWKNKVVPQENVTYSKDSVVLNMNNTQIILLPEEKEIPYDYYPSSSPYDYQETIYKRKIRVLEKENIVFEEELKYGDKHGSYYFLNDVDSRFSRISYSTFIFKPSRWLFDLFNLCIDDVIEFKRIKSEEETQNLIASQKKIRQDYYPA